MSHRSCCTPARRAATCRAISGPHDPSARPRTPDFRADGRDWIADRVMLSMHAYHSRKQFSCRHAVKSFRRPPRRAPGLVRAVAAGAGWRRLVTRNGAVGQCGGCLRGPRGKVRCCVRRSDDDCDGNDAGACRRRLRMERRMQRSCHFRVLRYERCRGRQWYAGILRDRLYHKFSWGNH